MFGSGVFLLTLAGGGKLAWLSFACVEAMSTNLVPSQTMVAVLLGLGGWCPEVQPSLPVPHSTPLQSCTAKTIIESECESAICKTVTFTNPNAAGDIEISYSFCGQDTKILKLGPGESSTKICKFSIARAHLTGAANGNVEWTIQ